jgi:hypothetical protein
VRCTPNISSVMVGCVASDGSVQVTPPELLTPLVRLPALDTLVLYKAAAPAALQIVRQMKHLTMLWLVSMQQFIQLMSGAGPLPPLEAVGILDSVLDVTDQTAPLLLKLQTLRSVALKFVIRDPTPLVPVLRNLHRLSVAFLPPCDLDLLVAALKHCTILTDLELLNEAFTAVHLSILLPLMPLLHTLTIISAGVTSLAFLTKATHLHTTLNTLRLMDCNLAASEIRSLKPLRALEELYLDRCFTAPLDANSLTMLTPDADGFMREWWPKLQKMEYIPKPVNG